MNANELADELTELIVAPTPVDDKWACELIDKAATMLRQQQAEIDALKENFNKENFVKEVFNKPVAWMNEYEQICHATDKKMEEITNSIGSPRNYFNYTIPLYTHPVKELNEAVKIIKDFQSDDVPPCKAYEDTYADGWMDACNEILWAIEEKAQEK